MSVRLYANRPATKLNCSRVFLLKEASQLRRPEGLQMQTKIKEHICPACNGTGFPPVEQPARAGHKIYPVKCKACDGKGKITEDD
jgi:DnaJ-class molecular chaperone